MDRDERIHKTDRLIESSGHLVVVAASELAYAGSLPSADRHAVDRSGLAPGRRVRAGAPTTTGFAVSAADDVGDHFVSNGLLESIRVGGYSCFGRARDGSTLDRAALCRELQNAIATT